MHEVERQTRYPEKYQEHFCDVFDAYEGIGQHSIDAHYGNDMFRISFDRTDDKLVIELDSVSYDGDWDPQYSPIYQVVAVADAEVHYMAEIAKESVPRDAYVTPEFVLRALLHAIQTRVRLRQRNSLK